MPSSISNSSLRAPTGAWGRTWTVSLLIAAVSLAGLEGYWRRAGHRPSIVDDIEWWSFHRARLEGAGPGTLALLGMSRIQLAISMPTLRRRLPGYRAVQLAMGARGPVAALHDLADDAAFRGVVVCSMDELYFHRSRWADQQEYVGYYHAQSSVDGRLNRLIDCAIQSRLVLVHPRVSFLNAAATLVRTSRLPEMDYLVTHFDRSISADYRDVPDLEGFRRLAMTTARQRYAAVEDTGRWLEDLAQLEPAVERIQRRGGQVVFVRFPSTGEAYRLSELYFPKESFWDPFAAGTRAIAIHFRDVPSLSDFECPDLSHLDYRDAPRFTAALVDELVRRGVFSQ